MRAIGLLPPLTIQKLKREHIEIESMGRFTNSVKENKDIWVIMDQLKK